MILEVKDEILAHATTAKVVMDEKNEFKQDEDDLEDGEIESDGEDVIIVKTIESPTPKKRELRKTLGEGNNTEAFGKPEKSKDVLAKSFNTDIVPKKSNKFKKPEVVDDDWAGNIENAIAAALKKDGIEPPLPKIEKRDDHSKESKSEEGPRSKGKKRKKRDNDRGEKRKKRSKLNEEQKLNNEDLDDYEMLCIRGGSPPPAASTGLHHPDDMLPQISSQPMYYDSDDSYTSYDSFESSEYRTMYDERRQRRARDRRQRKGGTCRSDKRRNRDDSDGGDECGRSHDSRPQRKLELCKFYLMECCAKREKCLYMHSDFPCKYFYLGMECVYKAACKFSHGKPLSDQLRGILLKHIETAPKEILGNFRRISRENATNLLNVTHAKLCADQGIENTLAQPTTPSITITNTVSSMPTNNVVSNNRSTNSNEKQCTSTIPSLLDMIIRPPTTSPRKDDKEKSTNKNEKPRKSRWCDNVSAVPGTASNLVNVSSPPPGSVISSLPIISTSSSIINSNPLLQNSSNPSTNNICATTTSNILSLQNLTGVITTEQIEKLSALGIENLDQVNQLTVLQLNNLGLSIKQINEIQLNALNIQKLGLISSSQTASNPDPIAIKPSNPILPASNSLFTTKTDYLCASLEDQKDIDMRFLGNTATDNRIGLATNTLLPDNNQSSTDNKIPAAKMITLVDAGIASPEPTSNSGKNIVSTGIKTNQPGIYGQDPVTSLNITEPENKQCSIVDYSQYLKDSHLDTEKSDLNDLMNDDKDDEVLNEDEPELLIDESWCPSDNDTKTDVFPDSNDTDDDDTRAFKSSLNKLLLPPMPAIYDPKTLLPASMITNKIDLSASVSKLLSSNANSINSSSNSNINNRLPYIVESTLNSDKNESTKVESTVAIVPDDDTKQYFRDPRLGTCLHKPSNDEIFNNLKSTADVSSSGDNDIIDEMVIYKRSSIYDGTRTKSPEAEEETLTNKKSDNDLRMSSFLERYAESSNCDIDLRLPFKPVMTNYTPATEIDGSISSHPPILYKVYEVDIPKPNYAEIRRTVPVTDTTLDPRLRRIFCLKESISGDQSNSSDESNLPIISKQIDNKDSTIAAASASTGPRIDPRRKKEQATSSQDIFSTGQMLLTGNILAVSGSTTSGNQSKNIDIRLLLQKSNWYKNLNSKYKIMVNQQLALVSTELKKFHQDLSPTKVFDMQFIASNQYLQQILTNLGIFIDANGQILQLDAENDIDNNVGGIGNMMGMPGMMDASGLPSGPGKCGISVLPMDFLRGPPPINQRFMDMSIPFRPRFADARPGLLGIAPGIQFNPFDGGNSGDGNFSGNNMPTSGYNDEQNFTGPNDGPPMGGGGFGGGLGGNPNFGGVGAQNSGPGNIGNNPFDQNNFYNKRHNDMGGDGRGDYLDAGNNTNNNNNNRQNNMRMNRNFRQGGNNNNNMRNNNANDRWSNNGPRNNLGQGGNRRNFDVRSGGGGGSGGRDNRRDKAHKS